MLVVIYTLKEAHPVCLNKDVNQGLGKYTDTQSWVHRRRENFICMPTSRILHKDY